MTTRTMEARAVISASDRTGGVFKRIAAQMRSLARQARTVNEVKGGGRGVVMDSARALAPLIAPAAAMVGIRKIAGEAMSLERTMYEVEKATDSSGEAAKNFERTILDLARATGKTKEELGSLLAAAGFAGRPVRELSRFTEYAAKATTAWGTNAEETGQALAELGNIYGANQARLEEIGDAINTAADQSASRETDLLEFLRRAGASAKQAGLSAEETLVFGAALKEVGVRSEVAATGFEALLNVLKLGEEFSKDAGEGLEQLGIDSTKLRKAFVVKPVETMVKFLQKLEKVSDPLKKAEIMTNLFGKEYQDDIAKLLNALPRINTLLGVMGDKANYIGSVRKGFDLIKEKDFNRIERATQAMDVLAVRTGNAFKIAAGGVAEGINAVVDKIEKGETIVHRILAAEREREKAAGRDPDEARRTFESLTFGDQESHDFWRTLFFGDKNRTLMDVIFPSQKDIDEAIQRAREEGRAERQERQTALQRNAVDLQERADRQRADGGFGLKDTERRLFIANHDLEVARRSEQALFAEQHALQQQLNALRARQQRLEQPDFRVFGAKVQGAGSKGVVALNEDKGITGASTGKAGGSFSQFGELLGTLSTVAANLDKPQPVDVTGKVAMDPASRATVDVRVKVEGEGRVVGMSAQSSGNIQAKVGTSMPHIANPAGR